MNEEDDLFQRAYQLQYNGELAKAISAYEKLIAQTPRHTQALHFLGLCYAQLGQMDKAISFLIQALEQEPENAILHNNLANAYKNRQQYGEAIKHYQQAIHFKPDYAQAHNNLATIYDLQDNYQQALHHYRQAIHAQPYFTSSHFNLGLLLLKHNQLGAAKKQFNNVIELNPDHIEAQFYNAVLNLEANCLDEAEQSFQNVVRQDNTHVQALTNLGVIALKRQQGQLAIDYFTKALAIDNEHVEARNNLAATFMHYDRFENALMHYDVLLQKDPNNIEYLYNSGVAQMALGHLNEAIVHFEQILEHDKKHFASLNNLAAIYIRLDEKKLAEDLLRRALASNPEDKTSHHMLSALTGDMSAPETSTEYATHLFDNYALYYDQHLLNQLKYSLPQTIAQLLHQLEISAVKQTIDLGCGTGLTGIVLREISQRLIGVDISAKMLERAKEKGIYDQLIEAELLSFLQKDSDYYDLAVAADVLPYFGELEELFSAIAKRIMPGGFFIFSTEISEDKPWQLQPTARFCHHSDYISNLCAQNGLEIMHQANRVARHQDLQGLMVRLYAVKKF